MKFQLGIMTDEVSQRIEDAIRVALDYGLKALELRSVDGKQLHQLEPERISQIGRQIDEAGLTVCALSTPVFKCNLDNADELKQSKEILAKDLQIAKTLGAGIIRGFSFWAQEGTTFEQAFPRIVEELQSIVPLLEEAQIVYALEFDPAVYATNGAKVARLVEAVGSPYIRALYDPGNDVWDPDGEIPYPDGYNHLKPYICHIHLKDAVRRGDEVEAVAIGTGEVDYKGLFARLTDASYDGYCIVETHYRLTSQLTEEQLKRPSGHSFSEGGEEASRQCVESLLRLLRELEVR